MPRILLTMLVILLCAATRAQQFAAEWMAAPEGVDSSCVWFRRTFTSESRPRRATVCVATAARFVLYVNGRNVSTALFQPAGLGSDGDRRGTVAVSYDVTQYLRRDSNTVALLIEPPAAIQPQGGAATDGAPLVAVGYYATRKDGTPFAHQSTDGWLCSLAPTSLAPLGRQHMDGRLNQPPHPARNDMEYPRWQTARSATDHATPVPSDLGMSAESIYGPTAASPLHDDAAYVHTTLAPRAFYRDGRTIAYDFGPGFCGFVRVTLRGCRRGERITIGQLDYVCSGETDEQAFARFCADYTRHIVITGDSRFRPEQVQEVEAVCL